MEPWRAVAAHNGGVEAQMEPQRICGPVVADLHHLVEEQDPSRIHIKLKSRIHLNGNVGSGSALKGERWIWIRIKVMQIRNSA
jgi:hypothetical protein